MTDKTDEMIDNDYDQEQLLERAEEKNSMNLGGALVLIVIWLPLFLLICRFFWQLLGK